MTIGERVRNLRLQKKESLQDVADAVQASKGHLWEIEKGDATNPSVDLVRRLADHFGTSVAWLVGEKPEAGVDDETAMALYRSLRSLSHPNREIVQTLVRSMLRPNT